MLWSRKFFETISTKSIFLVIVQTVFWFCSWRYSQGPLRGYETKTFVLHFRDSADNVCRHPLQLYGMPVENSWASPVGQVPRDGTLSFSTLGLPQHRDRESIESAPTGTLAAQVCIYAYWFETLGIQAQATVAASNFFAQTLLARAA